MMNLNENLKQLKMALTEHKDLKFISDDYEDKLYWDEEIKSYRGEFAGIWDLGLILKIISNEIENAKIELYEF